MELLFVVEYAFFLDGVGLVLAPGVPVSRALEFGTALFLVRPDGTHATARVQPLSTRPSPSTTRPIAVDLGRDEAPPGTRVFSAKRP